MLKACEEGVTEIWLTSEDTGAYGRDIGTNIVELLILLISNLPKDKMLRVGMTNPPYILEHLEAMCKIMSHPQVFTFLHIPVQAGNNAVLERMNREYTVEEFEKVCDTLIKNVPDMAVSTDIICGFPGETEEEFLGTLRNLEKYKFPAVNISQFYPRPGTVAARMTQVPGNIKKDRSRRVTSLFESYKNTNHMLNRVERVYISERDANNKSGDSLIGHTKNYTKVVLPYNSDLMGKCVTVRIDKVHTWHVEGTIVEDIPFTVPDPKEYFADILKIYEERKLEKERRQLERENERKNRIDKLRKEQDEKRQQLRMAEKFNTVPKVITEDPQPAYNQIKVHKKSDTSKLLMTGFGLALVAAGSLLYALGY